MDITTYKTRRAMPENQRETAKVCNKCKKWFSPLRFERTCMACLTPAQRALRVSRYKDTGKAKVVTKPAGQKAKNRTSRDVCRELAWELAAQEVSPEVVARSNRGPTMSKKEAFTLTQRNVNHGVQGACDLERYR
jgi:hypothetical protein